MCQFTSDCDEETVTDNEHTTGGATIVAFHCPGCGYSDAL